MPRWVTNAFLPDLEGLDEIMGVEDTVTYYAHHICLLYLDAGQDPTILGHECRNNPRLVIFMPGSGPLIASALLFSAMCSWPPPSYAHLGPCALVTLG